LLLFKKDDEEEQKKAADFQPAFHISAWMAFIVSISRPKKMHNA
jgi:hypothetical protein